MSGELSVVKARGDTYFFRIEKEDISHIVRYCESGNARDLIKDWLVLAEYGIETGILQYSDYVIVYKDYALSGFHKSVKIDDFFDENFVRNIAKWYRKIHSIGDERIRNRKDYFTSENILGLIKEYNLETNEFLNYVLKNYDNIKLKLNRYKLCLNVGKLDVGNLFSSRDDSYSFAVAMDEMCLGFKFEDIGLILEMIDEEFKDIFMEEYGEIAEEDILLSKVVGTIINLCVGIKCKKLPEDIDRYIDLINRQELLESARVLVEWY